VLFQEREVRTLPPHRTEDHEVEPLEASIVQDGGPVEGLLYGKVCIGGICGGESLAGLVQARAMVEDHASLS
jgi:hypothetical protein